MAAPSPASTRAPAARVRVARKWKKWTGSRTPSFTLPDGFDAEPQAPRQEWPLWFAVLVWGLIPRVFFSFAYRLTKR